jgi:hypothetical protein
MDRHQRTMQKKPTSIERRIPIVHYMAWKLTYVDVDFYGYQVL